MSAQNFSLKSGAKSVWFKRGVALGVLAGFAWLIIAAVTSSNDNENLEPTLVQAPDMIKQRPETPGGMKIDHQDKQLFDLLETETSADETTDAVVAEAKASENKNAELVKQAIEKKALEEQKTEEATKTVVLDVKPEEPVKTVEVKQVVAEQPAKTATPAPAPVKEEAKLVVSGWAVQLGSFRKDSDAERAVSVYNKKVGNILVGLTPHVKKVDLGEKGTVYRVYFTGLTDGEHAKQICSQLKAQKQACLRAKI